MNAQSHGNAAPEADAEVVDLASNLTFKSDDEEAEGSPDEADCSSKSGSCGLCVSEGEFTMGSSAAVEDCESS